MADITHNDSVVTESKLTEFYNDIKPFLGCPAYLTSEGNSDYYSTDEKVIGRWTNGKPLYQKTFIDTMPTATSTTGGRKAVSIGSSIEEAFLITADMVTNGTVLPLYNTNSGMSIYARVMITTNTTSENPNCVLFDLAKGGQGWSGYPVKATIRYTKTTDSASTTIQEDPNEYSTDEKIIGKWIDGKPIYQKTVNCGALPTGSSGTASKEVDPNIPNIKNVINIFGNAFGIYNSMYCSKPLPFVHYSENSGNVLLDFNNGKIRFISNANYSSLNAYVTLQYTKTTD